MIHPQTGVVGNSTTIQNKLSTIVQVRKTHPNGKLQISMAQVLTRLASKEDAPRSTSLAGFLWVDRRTTSELCQLSGRDPCPGWLLYATVKIHLRRCRGTAVVASSTGMRSKAMKLDYSLRVRSRLRRGSRTNTFRRIMTSTRNCCRRRVIWRSKHQLASKALFKRYTKMSSLETTTTCR